MNNLPNKIINSLKTFLSTFILVTTSIPVEYYCDDKDENLNSYGN